MKQPNINKTREERLTLRYDGGIADTVPGMPHKFVSRIAG